MEYKLDFEDVHFTLFDFLKVEQLTQFPRFEGQGEDLYRSVVEEGLKFAKNEIAPLNEKGDRIGAKVVNGNVQMPPGFKEVFQKFGENGFVGIDLDPEWGGMGLPTTISTVMLEFVLGASTGFGLCPLLSHGTCNLLQAFGSNEQKQLFLSKMMSGQWTGTMCLTEPQAGSAVGDITTTARKNPDGSYSIHGTKIFITYGNHDMAENIIHFVLARVEGDAPGTKGISLFIVPTRRVNADGSLAGFNDVKLVSIEHKMGVHASPTCLLQFGDSQECQGFLLGKQSEGMKYMFQMMNEARLAVGQQGVAGAAAAYENALQYAKDRSQGGRPIVEYPDVRRMLLTMKAYVEGLRALTYEAGMLVDYSLHHPDEKIREEYEGYSGLMTPVCKAFGSDMGFRVCELAIQTYGGYGYIQDYPAEQHMRDIKIASLYEGTNGIQAMDLIGRKFARNKGEHLARYLKRSREQLQPLLEKPELKTFAEKVLSRIDQFENAARLIVQKSAQNPDALGLAATPFLRALGDVATAQILVRRANSALQQLQSGPSHREKFLKGKIEVAKFYVEQMLPEADLNLVRITSEDRSAMSDLF